MPPVPPPFDLDFDKFDMLSEFPDLDHYNAASAASAQAMIHHGASGPLLSSAMAPKQQQPPVSAPQPRHNIAEYSPDWAWSEVSTIELGVVILLLQMSNISK